MLYTYYSLLGHTERSEAAESVTHSSRTRSRPGDVDVGEAEQAQQAEDDVAVCAGVADDDLRALAAFWR